MLKRPLVDDVMTKDVVTVRPEASYKRVVELLTEHRISGLPVVDTTGVVVGVVSEADLLHKEEFAPSGDDTQPLLQTRHRRIALVKARGDTAAELMSAPAITVSPYLKVGEAARILSRRGIKRLPVVDDRGRLVGIVTRADLLTVFLRDDDDIRDEIVEQVIRRNLWEDPGRVRVEVTEGVVTLRGQVELDTLVPITANLTAAVPGVVDVVNELSYAEKAADRMPSAKARSRAWPW